jgi:gliding motility-associated-like protein
MTTEFILFNLKRINLKTKSNFSYLIIGIAVFFANIVLSQTTENQQIINEKNKSAHQHSHDHHGNQLNKQTVEEGKAYNLVKSLDIKGLKNRLIKEVGATEADFNRFYAFHEFNLRFYILELKEKVEDPKFDQNQFEAFVNQKFRESVFEFKRFLNEDKEFKARVTENEYSELFNSVHKITHSGHTPNQPAAAGEPCQNMDFSGGTSAWRGNYCRGLGFWSDVNDAQCWNGFGNGQYTQMTGGNDGNFASIPRVPTGSTRALRLGNTSSQNDRATIWQTFRVSQSNYIFVYKWAAVLNNAGNHSAATSPYFKVRMYLNYGASNQQEINCATVNANSQTANQWGFSTSGGYRYKNWTTMFVPLNQYIGQDVTIWFETSDCMVDGGTHEGYAYIWANCIPPNITLSQPAICNGGNITITAPPGANNYSWSSSPAGAIQGSTTGQTITATQGNVTYFVTMTTNTQPPYAPCSVTLDTTIAVQPNITPVFTQIPPICQGASLSNLPTTSTNGIVGNWSPAINNNQTTNYSFVPNANQCANNTQMTIEVNPNITPVFNPINPICSGDQLSIPTISTNNISGVWNPQPTNTSSATYTFAPGPGQCASTTTLSVVVNPSPSVQISGVNTICSGQSTDLIAGNASTYSWSPSSGLSSTNTANVMASPVSSTVYTLNVTDQNGCTGNTTYSVTVNPIPELTAISSQTLCAGQSVTGINFSSSVPNSTINWINNETGISLAANGTGNITTFNGTNAGNTSITSVVTATPTANGCTGDPQSFTITVNPIPTLSVIPSQSICSGSQINGINFNSSVANSTINWSNSQPVIGLTGSGSGDIDSFNGTNTGNSQVTATIIAIPTANGCDGAPQSFSLTVNPIPSLAIIPNQTLCAGQSVLGVNFSSTVLNSTVNWTNSQTSIGLAGNGSGNIATFNGINSGNTQVVSTIIATPIAYGCTGAPQNFSITINPVPYLNNLPNHLYCSGISSGEIVFYPSVANSTVNWTNSQTGIGLSSSGTGNISSFTTLNPGTTALVSVISATPTVLGCNGSAKTFSITVNPIPQLNSIQNQTICAGEQVNAINFSSTVINSTIDWTNTQASVGLSAIGTGNIASFTGINTGNSPVTALVTATPTANGCIGEPENFSVTVNPIPVLNSIGNQVVCSGQLFNPINYLSTVNNSNVSWTNSQVSIGLSESGNGSISSFTGINNGLTPITGLLTATPTANGCVGQPINYALTVNPNPTGITANNTFENCSLNNATLTITNASGGTSPYLYSVNNSIPSATNLNFSNLSAGTYTLAVIDANGCTFSKTVTINNIPGPSADFIANQQNGSDTLNVDFTNQSSYGNNITYYWNFGNGNLDTTTNLNFSPNQTFYGTNTYTVTLIASNGIPGCNDTTSLLIYVDITPFIEVPNVFSPNGDDANEFFSVKYKGYKDLNMIIYNRWGNKLFETTNPGLGWDGNGASEGTYYYIVTGKSMRDEPFETKGYLTLVK